MAVACAGYRIPSGTGHHRNTLEAVRAAIPSGRAFADYFDDCRRKRNRIDYEYARVATETEAKEMLSKAREFEQLVEEWIAAQHPEFRQGKKV
jgi:hypothetical protein